MSEVPSCASDERELTELILHRTPLIDVRAPIEFARGAAPEAVNLPLLNDHERAAVGTAYKQEGSDAAITLGHRFLSGETRQARMQAWQEFIQTHPQAHLYCFRGGLRSQSVHQVLWRERGLQVPVVAGGYKRIRSFLLDSIEKIARSENFAVLSGFTGSGKTDFLRESACGVRVLDLERLATHRGSAFGKLGAAQPSQSDFENRLAADLLRLNANRSHSGPIWLEDESRAIGRVSQPQAIFQRLMTAPVFVIERSVAERAQYLISTYLIENYNLRDGQKPDDEFEAQIDRLGRDLDANLLSIERRLGGATRQAISALVTAAITEHRRTGSFAPHEAWVIRLLETYYDPLYRKHLDSISERIVFRGEAEALAEKLRAEASS